jgi:catechol 2,3-dioxygenase-like lactoylglutathione lyase family enzyme
MKLGHLEVHSADVQASLKFWVTGLGFTHEADQGPFQWVRLEGFEVLIRPSGESAHGKGSGDGPVQPVFYVSDLDAARTRLCGLGFDLTEEDDCLFVKDPGGLWIQIVNPEGHQ